MSEKRDYYDILGLSRSATKDEIREAFRRLAKSTHPDRNPDDPEAVPRYKALLEAYEVLNDAKRRQQYDEKGVRLEEPAPPTADGKPDKARVSAGSIADLFSGRGKRPPGKAATGAGLGGAFAKPDPQAAKPSGRTSSPFGASASKPRAAPKEDNSQAELDERAQQLAEQQRELAARATALEKRDLELMVREERLALQASELKQRAADLERQAQAPTDAPRRNAELNALAAELSFREEKLAIETAELRQRAAELERKSLAVRPRSEDGTRAADLDRLAAELEARSAELDRKAADIDRRAAAARERSGPGEVTADMNPTTMRYQVSQLKQKIAATFARHARERAVASFNPGE